MYGVRDEIRDTLERFYRAISSKNLKGVESALSQAPYTSLAGRKGDILQGWYEIRRYWEQRFRQWDGAKVTTRLTGVACHAIGDVGWISGTEIRTLSDGDQVRQERLRMTSVLERAGTNWQIVSYHVSRPLHEDETLASAS